MAKRLSTVSMGRLLTEAAHGRRMSRLNTPLVLRCADIHSQSCRPSLVRMRTYLLPVPLLLSDICALYLLLLVHSNFVPNEYRPSVCLRAYLSPPSRYSSSGMRVCFVRIVNTQRKNYKDLGPTVGGSMFVTPSSVAASGFSHLYNCRIGPADVSQSL